ncbi:MAG: T9SS type A sorting domain-containing protein [Cyclobacteriaceae bacterium]|jgi:hypothetical protein|nr:T9SS type A sorting domain-containing protein [Cyclobacteriaceae bacterium]
MKKQLVFLVSFLVTASSVVAQTVGDYRTVASGDWDDITIWQRFDGVSFVPATVFPEASNANAIVVRNPHSVAIAAGSDGIAIDQLTIQSGATFTVEGFSIVIENGAGTDLVNAGTISADPAAIQFSDNSTYEHAQNGGEIPAADWGADSECLISGVTNTAPLNLAQNFYHLTWSSSQTGNVNLNGALTEVILGNFTISNTGATNERLRFFTDGGSGEVLSVSGNLIISGGASVAFTNTGSDCQVFIGGDFINSSSRRQTLALGAGGSIVMEISGNLNHSVNALRLTANASASAVINLTGNFSLAGTALSASASSTAQINFISGGLQTFTRSGTPLQSGPLAWRVVNNSTLDVAAASFLAGTTTTSSFFLEAGSTLITRAVSGIGTNTAGAIQATTTQGTLRVATALRTFENGSTIVYQGSAAQQLGSGHPTNVNTIINNPAGVTTVGSRSILGDLTLQSGNLTIAATNSLTLGNTITAGGNFIIPAATSDIVLLGDGLSGTFPFQASSVTFRNFTLNRSGGSITFPSNVTLTGVTALTNGELDFSGRTLILNGSFNAPGGSLRSTSTTSILQIGGTGAFGTLVMSSPPGNTVGTFTYNRTSGTLTNATDLLIGSTFNLNNGSITNAGRLIMANNSTLLRTASGATISTNRPEPENIGNTYNVTYSATLTTALELPDASTTTDLGALTVTTGTVTLSQPIFVNGNVVLIGGTLAQGVHDITMQGAQWNDNSGGITASTGTVVFNSAAGTVVSGTSTPQFIHVALNNGAALTLPSLVNISGNIQINSSSTLNAGATTLVLNGTTSTSFAGGGKTYLNITQAKTASADVTLTSGVNLRGVLSVVNNGSDFASGGLLTLVSNASGTASVAQLLAGRTVSGNVTAQRFINGVGRFYRDVSSPVSGATVQQVISSGVTVTGNFTGTSFPCAGCVLNNPSLYFYDETVAGLQAQGYTAFPPSGGNSATSIFSVGRGYNLFVRNEVGSPTVSLVGPINSGSINLPVSYTTTAGGPSEDGWNFVGNPYPSAIDWDIALGWTKTNISGNQISVYDPTKPPSGGYRVWNGSLGDLGNGRIASGQGFWVKATATPTLTVNESAKSTTSTPFYRMRDNGDELNFLRLDVVGNQFEDAAFLQKHPEALHVYDNSDGNKLSVPESPSLAIQSADGIALSINSIGVIRENDEFGVRLLNVQPGEYQLLLRELSGEFGASRVKIRDRFLRKEQSLTLGSSYPFKVSDAVGSKDPHRFVLIFGDGLSELGNAVSKVYPNPTINELNVEVWSGSVPQAEVLDINGRGVGTIAFQSIDEGLWVGKALMGETARGMYIVRIKSEFGVETVKVLKK